MKLQNRIVRLSLLTVLLPFYAEAITFEERAVAEGYPVYWTNAFEMSAASPSDPLRVTSLEGATNYMFAFSINLDGSDLPAVDADAFNGLLNLNELEMNACNISNLNALAFNGLSGLMHLSLENNQLTALTNNQFADTYNLELIDLSNNQIESIASDALAFRLGLRTIELDGNNLSSITSDHFLTLTNLYTLNLSGNQITNIALDAFNYLGSATNINLGGNQLTSISSEFSNVGNLQKLNLGTNSISSLSPTAFQWLNNLTELQLQNNQLSTFPASVLYGLNNLDRLFLGGNGLSSLEFAQFAGASKLDTLDLSGNSLTSLATDDFLGMTNLHVLGLAGNQLTAISEGAFNEIYNLADLDLGANLLTGVETNQVGNTPSLINLYLTGNQITNFGDGAFAGLDNLQTLDLANNQLTTLNFNYGELDQLISLNIDGNAITVLSLENANVSQGAFDTIMAAFNAGVPAAAPMSFGMFAVAAIEEPGNHLETISLQGTEMSGLALDALYELDTITSLNLDGTGLGTNEIVNLVSELDAMQTPEAVLFVDEAIKEQIFDGLADAGYDTNNGNDDVDNDRMLDVWEQNYFGGISTPGGGANDDKDGDFSPNLTEYIAGTDPTNGNSRFEVSTFSTLPSGKIINWEPVTGRVYSVMWTDHLANGFQVLTNGITHPQSSYTDTVHTAEGGGFYNLKVELQ